ncbi:fungal-specific transcription factor domain-containing protein [Aspergillus cavernicola]|uniref:Fungal-specific transcription factor domain-containing protein n=1 Tax=Aspergillus cavernicola TaxID=176166 RepID=A0ABR4HL28_9EURO
MDATTDSSHNQTQQVCKSCKTRKRKCDKAIPKCSLCARKNLKCEYTRRELIFVPSPSTSAACASISDPWWPAVSEERAAVQPITLPTILFLDPTLLQHGPLELPHPDIPIPPVVLSFLGDIETIRSAADKFFTHIHAWMPFISKKRFYDFYITPEFQSKPEVILLSLSIKLITTIPLTSQKTPLYTATKHFYLDVEGSSTLSILILQAGILIALYELGHGIYPAAYLSIGNCTRYAYTLGINGTNPSQGNTHAPKVLSLVEVEERRRVWWAIIILDRFITIASPTHPLATPNPELHDLLPSNDADWDNGTINPAEIHPLSCPNPNHMSRFALLCQAARLLGQVHQFHQQQLRPLPSDRNRERERDTETDTETDTDDETRNQLDRTLQSMLAASLTLEWPDYDQITFIYR